MSIKHKLIEINEIENLFSEIQNEKLKRTLMYKLSEDLDALITKYDSKYYKAYTNKRYRRTLIRNTDIERHETIINTQNTLNTFLPYMLLHNLTNT
jgi:uncharacterized protein (DUF2344 family)